MAKHPLPGSDRAVARGAKIAGQCDPHETIDVVVTLRRRDEPIFRALVRDMAAGEPAAQPLSRAAFSKRFGASDDDLAKLAAFAAQHGLTMARVDTAACTVVLRGAIAQFQQAFDVTLHQYDYHASGQFRGRTGPVHLPDELRDVVTAVLGLDNRPQARPHFRIRPPFRPAATPPAIALSPLQLGALYRFPAGDGAGQCIGIIELGGGYRPDDLRTYFDGLGVARPTVVPIAIHGGGNQPSGDPGGPDGEVTLDIEIAGALAPGATLAVYFTQNSDAGFLDAVSRAVHDTTHNPSVISISWGGPEDAWTAQSLRAFDTVLQEAAALGVTVCAAAGDNGSGDGAGDGRDHVDFPAASPYALACGGTRVQVAGQPPDQTIALEVVWNDGSGGGASGGGISRAFPVPAWQDGLSVLRGVDGSAPLPGRGVPDVAGDASPMTGYEVLIDGVRTVVGGTSAVAPLWAALIARINVAKGRPAGYVNPKLYRAAGVCNDITQGNNGTFAAAPGWDACTGLGSPDGEKVAAVL
ncbi:peptidase S53 [Pandoraea terrae]|uniref:Peptidase S53 n=2 Tax=Pandoraea terrae TaxID=1537710 RepID=A0A5E4RJ99_9BURK|nr:peptidase S53 [Pandoraea terrae]